MVRPLILVWPHAIAFWTLYSLVVVPELMLQRRSRLTAEAHRAQDRGSVRILHAADHSAFWLAVMAALFLPGATVTLGRDVVFVVGLVFLAAGGLLRRHCFRSLGPLFSGTVHVVKNQPIVEHGAYRYLRHPSYTGGFLISAGVGLAFTNWVSVGVFALGSVVGYVFRVRAEERAMLETLGEPYRAYMKRTKRFVPFVF